MIVRQALTALLALWALAAPAAAQNVTNPVPPFSINGAYNATAPTCTDGNGCWFQTTVNGYLLTAPGGGGSTATSGTSIATAQVSVTNASTATVAARTGRLAVTITATGSSAQDVYCGPGTITTATGDIIPGVKGAARTYNTSAAINCIVGSSTQTVTVSETY